jgi:hypothetical protein
MADRIRTVHHQACTGGSMISRCIAVLPGVALVSEVSPVADPRPRDVRFDPLNVVGAFLNGYPEARPDLATMVEAFGAQLRLTTDLAERAGLRLVVRDHSHSGYMRAIVQDRSAFLAACASFPDTLSLVTVRYPFSSYVSMRRKGWDRYLPDYADYCRRYLRFLDDHAAIPRVRYEAFCTDPQGTMQQICRVLDVPFDATFEERWTGHNVTGNSGRGAAMSSIQPLPFRDWTPERADELSRNPDHANLCGRLGYPSDLTAYAVAANEEAGIGPVAAIEPAAGPHEGRLRHLLDRHRPRE